MEGQNTNLPAQSDASLAKENQDNQQDTAPTQSEIVNNANQNQEEESKISDRFANMNIKDKPAKEDKAVSPEESTGKAYVMVHQSPKNWKIVVETLKPVQGQKKIDFNTMLTCIQTFIKKIEGNAGRNLDNLKAYFSNLNNAKKSELETRVFPMIVSLILETPKLFPDQLPLLVQWRGQRIKLSKKQCACLLSHMFMCTTLQQGGGQKLPNSFRFAEIFDKDRMCNDVKVAKIACVLNYFSRISQEIRPTYVIFERLVLNEAHGSCTLDAWRECNDPVGRAEIRPQGKIEDAEGCIEIDFANKFLGGGVMRNGAAQEEIQFATSPELLIGVLFFEVMADKEAILIKGTEVYCAYKGYLDKFRFSHDHRDEITAIRDDILEREVVAIDAINFKSPIALPQFSDDGVLRELNKAYVGFYGGENKKDKTVNKPISTGKWGCGVFKGDTQLKFVIQWLACSRAHRDMVFYSFGDHKEMKDAEVVLEYYKDKKVGELVGDLLECCERIEKSDRQNPELFKTLIELKSIKKNDS